MNIKLDLEQRRRASKLVDWVIENPDDAAHELIGLRDAAASAPRGFAEGLVAIESLVNEFYDYVHSPDDACNESLQIFSEQMNVAVARLRALAGEKRAGENK